MEEMTLPSLGVWFAEMLCLTLIAGLFHELGHFVFGKIVGIKGMYLRIKGFGLLAMFLCFDGDPADDQVLFLTVGGSVFNLALSCLAFLPLPRNSVLLLLGKVSLMLLITNLLFWYKADLGIVLRLALRRIGVDYRLRERLATGIFAISLVAVGYLLLHFGALGYWGEFVSWLR